MSTTGDRLKEERQRLGLNQTDFGALAGVQKQAQLKYEKGERSPDADYLAAVAQAGTDVQYIITGVRSSVALAPDERLLVERYRESPRRAAIGGCGEANLPCPCQRWRSWP